MEQRNAKQEIACQQVLLEDSSVYSVQWSLFPAEIATKLSPQLLLEHYLSYIRTSTFSVITPLVTDAGVNFCLLGSRLSIIRFLPPSLHDGTLTLHICGGLLVQAHQCHRGELKFSVEAETDGTKVTLQLSDYCPLILGSSSPSPVRRWLYRLTQATIHRLVTVRFLALLYRDLTGHLARVQVVPVQERSGRPI
jgi:hypothetical protein